MKNKVSLLSVFLAASCILIWGITFVSTKYLLNDFSAFEILFIRFFMALIALFLMKPGKIHFNDLKTELLYVGAGFCGVTFYQFVENIALSYTMASNVSIIVSITPMITAIISQLVLKENHLNFWFILGFCVAIFGIALVTFNGSVVLHLSPKGDLLAFAAACSWGFYSLFVSKINKLGRDPIKNTRRSFFWSLVLMIPICVFGMFFSEKGGQTFINLDFAVNAARWKNGLNWFNLMFLGIGASAYCFAAWNVACKNLGTVKTTLGIYISPIITILFAFVALGEKITLMGAAGAVLTITGLFLSHKK